MCDPINIPFDPARTPRAQIEAALASLPGSRCVKHPHELRPVDKRLTVMRAIQPDYGTEFTGPSHACQFTATHDNREGRQLYTALGFEWLQADRIPQEQFEAWRSAREAALRREFGNGVPRLPARQPSTTFPVVDHCATVRPLPAMQPVGPRHHTRRSPRFV